MEVLSFRIYLEEPDACILISNAMNYAEVKNSYLLIV